MTTKLSDLVAHDKEFLSTVAERTTDKAVFRAAGIAVRNPLLDARASGAGNVTSIPFWKALTQTEASIGSDDDAVSITAGKITQGEQKCARHFRNAAWTSMDLAGIQINDDPMTAIGNAVGDYWAVEDDKMVISTLKGILAADLAGSDVLYSATNFGLAPFSYTMLQDGLGTVGDAAANFNGGAIVMHSRVYRKLLKDDQNDFVKASATQPFDTYAGYRIIQSDLMPEAAGVYTSVLCAPGSILVGEGVRPNAVAVQRDELKGNGSGMETLVHRRQMIIHPNGFQFNASAIASTSASNAELEEAAQWTQALQRKNLGLVYFNSTVA